MLHNVAYVSQQECVRAGGREYLMGAAGAAGVFGAASVTRQRGIRGWRVALAGGLTERSAGVCFAGRAGGSGGRGPPAPAKKHAPAVAEFPRGGVPFRGGETSPSCGAGHEVVFRGDGVREGHLLPGSAYLGAANSSARRGLAAVVGCERGRAVSICSRGVLRVFEQVA